MAEPRAESVIFLSDGHRGAPISNLPKYEPDLLRRLKGYDHIVIAGDWFELMFVPQLEEKNGKPSARKHVLRNAVREARHWLEELLKDNPCAQVYFVLGNHENIRKFRHTLDRLAKMNPCFEWHPEAIRLGDALVMHGDLALRNQVDSPHGAMPDNDDPPDVRPISRLRDAERGRGWAQAVVRLGDSAMHKYWASRVNTPERMAAAVHARLAAWDGKGHLRYRHGREERPLTMDWVKHVIFGHTHMKFHHMAIGGVQYHNSGSFTKSAAAGEEDLGILEGELIGGELHHLRPAPLIRAEAHILPFIREAGGFGR